MTKSSTLFVLALCATCTDGTQSATSYLAEPGVTVAKSADGKVVVVAAGLNTALGFERTLADHSAGHALAGFGYAPQHKDAPASMAVLSLRAGNGYRFRVAEGALADVQKEANVYLGKGFQLNGLAHHRPTTASPGSFVFWLQRTGKKLELFAFEGNLKQAVAKRGENGLPDYLGYAGFKLRDAFYKQENAEESSREDKEFASGAILEAGGELSIQTGNSELVERRLINDVDNGKSPLAFVYGGAVDSTMWLEKSYTATEDHLRAQAAPPAKADAKADGDKEDQKKDEPQKAVDAQQKVVNTQPRQKEYRFENAGTPEALAALVTPLLLDDWQPGRIDYRGTGTVVWLRCSDGLRAVSETDVTEPLAERLERMTTELATQLARGCRVYQVSARGEEALAVVVDNSYADSPAKMPSRPPVAPAVASVVLLDPNSGWLRDSYTDYGRHSNLMAISFNSPTLDHTSVVLLETDTREGKRFRMLSNSSADVAMAADKLLAKQWRVFDFQYRRARNGEPLAFWLSKDKHVRFLMEPLGKLNNELYHTTQDWNIARTFFGSDGDSKQFDVIAFVSKDGAFSQVLDVAQKAEARLTQLLDDGWALRAFAYNPDAAPAAGKAAVWLRRSYGGRDEYRLVRAEEPGKVAADVTELMGDHWEPLDAFYGGAGVAAYMKCNNTMRTVVEPNVETDATAQKDFGRRIGVEFSAGCSLFRLVHRGEKVMAVFKARKPVP